MIRWAFMGILFAGAIGAFAWWRSSVLEDLPPPTAPVQAPRAVSPSPVTENREEMLRFEEEQLRQKAAAAGVEFTTSTPEAPAAPTSSSPEDVPPASSTIQAMAVASTATSTESAALPAAIATTTAPVATSTPAAPAETTSTPTSIPASAPTSTASSTAATSTAVAATPAASSSPASATSTAQAKSNPRQFQIDGAGFCGYNAGVSSAILSGYPLVNDVGITGSGIQSWTATRVVFVVPDSVPAGTYKVTVRGVSAAGYCTASASSPSMVVVP